MAAFFAPAASAFRPPRPARSLSPSPLPRSSHEDAASVRPESSSTSWAKMPRFERNRRGGAFGGAADLPRTRRWRRRRASLVESDWSRSTPPGTRHVRRPAKPAPAGGAEARPAAPRQEKRAAWETWSPTERAGGERRSRPLPYLPAHRLALVADALALVGLGRARNLPISAAVWPTACLSMPRTTTWVGSALRTSAVAASPSRCGRA